MLCDIFFSYFERSWDLQLNKKKTIIKKMCFTQKLLVGERVFFLARLSFDTTYGNFKQYTYGSYKGRSHFPYGDSGKGGTTTQRPIQNKNWIQDL